MTDITAKEASLRVGIVLRSKPGSTRWVKRVWEAVALQEALQQECLGYLIVLSNQALIC